jgi:hypothetical protein
LTQAIGGARGGAAQGRWVGPAMPLVSVLGASSEEAGQITEMPIRTRRSSIDSSSSVTIRIMRSSGVSSSSADCLIAPPGMSWARFPRVAGELAVPKVHDVALASGPPRLVAGAPHRNASARNAGTMLNSARRSMGAACLGRTDRWRVDATLGLDSIVPQGRTGSQCRALRRKQGLRGLRSGPNPLISEAYLRHRGDFDDGCGSRGADRIAEPPRFRR